MATRFYMPLAQWISSLGVPGAGYKLYFYTTLTSTPLDTFSDDALTVPNTNPVVADSTGTWGPIFLSPTDYKVVLTTSTGTQVGNPMDPVHGGLQASILVGPVGIDMTPVNELDISKNANSAQIAQFQNTNTGVAATVVWQLRNSTPSTASFTLNGGSFTTAGILRQDGAVISCSGAGGLTLNTSAAQPLYFGMNGTETAEFTTNRCFLVTTDGTYLSSSATRHEMTNHFTSSYVVVMNNKQASTPFGVQVNYSAAAPNGTGNEFVVCVDSSTTRATIRSNGGLANFSANNVNLSDISVKPEFQKHTPSDLAALEASFVAVDWGKFKYADQTHSDWNYGYSAQGVEAAFALTVPAMTDVWNPETAVDVDDGTGKMVRSTIATPIKDQLRAVYTEDLNNIAHALLATALNRIAVLESRLAKAGIP